MCSTAAMRHFKAVVFRKPPEAFAATVAPKSVSRIPIEGLTDRRRLTADRRIPLNSIRNAVM